MNRMEKDQDIPRADGQEQKCALSSARLAHLKPGNGAGAIYFGLAMVITVSGLGLGAQGSFVSWAAGQVFIALAFTLWFCLLHEAGHGTLFRTRWMNAAAGFLAGIFALIPFQNWKRIHALHHRWTGWQDLDPTTEGLTRKPGSRALITLANLCWRWWVPLFAVVYRLANYWNVPRLRRIFPHAWRSLAFHAGLLILLYLAAALWAGVWECLSIAGAGIWIGLMFQDIFLLSQHTHLPQNLSQGKMVRPVPPLDQEIFTRSLRFPEWFSRWFLVHADAHELHHMYPQLPGYRLRQVPYSTQNEMSWWQWTLAARRIPAEVFLYQNRNQTGLKI